MIVLKSRQQLFLQSDSSKQQLKFIILHSDNTVSDFPCSHEQCKCTVQTILHEDEFCPLVRI